MLSEIKITPVHTGKLRAYVTVVLHNEIVLKNIKVIKGDHGLFLSMPNRMYREQCSNRNCRQNNVIRARFCNWCGQELEPKDYMVTGEGRQVYVDVAHPISVEVRRRMEHEILSVYREVVKYPHHEQREPIERQSEVEARRRPMLKMSRKAGQFIFIGKEVKVIIGRVQGNRVEISVEAPRNFRIMRGPELVDGEGNFYDESDGKAENVS